MPRKTGNSEPLKDDLVAQIEAERARLLGESRRFQGEVGRLRGEIRETFDVRTRFHHAVADHPWAWLAAGLGVGMAAAAAFDPSNRRSGKAKEGEKITSQKRNSILTTFSFALGWAGKAAFRALRPSLEESLRERLEGLLTTRTPPAPPPTFPRSPLPSQSPSESVEE